ncbi:MAG: site-specific integrase [Proteobacteria bacterium]|nr:site-specific integrase [Pseudomonadota bacterium]
MTGFLLRVQPSGAMTYYLSYYNKQGKRKRYRIGTTKSVKLVKARDIAEDKAADVTKGVDIATEKKRKREEGRKIKTLEDYIVQEYKDWVLTHRRSGEDTLKRLKSCFGDWYGKDMLEITPWIVQKWQVSQKKNGKTPQTINRDVTALKAVLSKAKENKFIGEHPLKNLKPLDAPESERVRYLSKAEEKRLRKALMGRDDKIKKERRKANLWRRTRGYPLYPDLDKYKYPDYVTPMILITINTGVRQTQLFRLTWDKISLTEKIMSVTTYKGAKTGIIKIPLNSEVIDVLKAWEKFDGGKGLVFKNPNTGKELTSVKSSWRKVIKDAKISDFRWRDMRHHAASWLVMAGVALEVIQQILGHRDIRTTQRYAHISDEYKQNAVEKLLNRD